MINLSKENVTVNTVTQKGTTSETNVTDNLEGGVDIEVVTKHENFDREYTLFEKIFLIGFSLLAVVGAYTVVSNIINILF